MEGNHYREHHFRIAVEFPLNSTNSGLYYRSQLQDR